MPHFTIKILNSKIVKQYVIQMLQYLDLIVFAEILPLIFYK